MYIKHNADEKGSIKFSPAFSVSVFVFKLNVIGRFIKNDKKESIVSVWDPTRGN